METMSERRCDGCGRVGVTVQVYQTRGTEYHELWLCGHCADAIGVDASNAEPAPTAGELLSGLVHRPTRSCPECGTTFKQIRRTGMVGCAECYRAFRARIIPLIRPATGRVQHIGRFPERLEAFKRLFVDREHYRQELDEAVELEDYERAALLRDKINEISGSHGEDG